MGDDNSQRLQQKHSLIPTDENNLIVLQVVGITMKDDMEKLKGWIKNKLSGRSSEKAIKVYSLLRKELPKVVAKNVLFTELKSLLGINAKFFLNDLFNHFLN